MKTEEVVTNNNINKLREHFETRQPRMKTKTERNASVDISEKKRKTGRDEYASNELVASGKKIDRTHATRYAVKGGRAS